MRPAFKRVAPSLSRARMASHSLIAPRSGHPLSWTPRPEQETRSEAAGPEPGGDTYALPWGSPRLFGELGRRGLAGESRRPERPGPIRRRERESVLGRGLRPQGAWGPGRGRSEGWAGSAGGG